jgi:hypothetical protein
VMFPRRWRAPLVVDGSGRHLQHWRGEGEVRGKTIWPENCSKEVLTELVEVAAASVQIPVASAALRRWDMDKTQGGGGASLKCDLRRGWFSGRKFLTWRRPVTFKGRRGGVEQGWGPGSLWRHANE